MVQNTTSASISVICHPLLLCALFIIFVYINFGWVFISLVPQQNFDDTGWLARFELS